MSLALVACDDSTTEPRPSLVGTWDLVRFTDAGVAAITTGTAEFREDDTFSVQGSVTFPSEPPDTVSIVGTFRQTGETVDLTIDEETTTWTLDFDDDRVVLTEVEPPPANEIGLQRRR